MLHLDMVISNNKKLLVACKKMLIHKTSVMQKEVGNHVNEFRSFNMDGLR